MTKLFICGDILNYNNKKGLICSESLANLISKADYSICNFEAPVGKVGKHIIKSGPHHSQRLETISGLKNQGFNLMCMANNHIMDYGSEALKDTMNEARNTGLETIGAGLDFDAAYKPLIKTIQGEKIGFINVCEAHFGVINYNSPSDQAGYAWINHDLVDKQIIELKSRCDHVVVLAHAGLEHYSIPQKEWKQRYRHFCDLGADVIVGSHPHVPQGYENYKNSMIFYSLGNFYFDSKKYVGNENKTYSLILTLNKNEKIAFEPVFHYMKNGITEIAPIEKQIDLKLLNKNLSEDYENLNDAMALEAYESIVENKLINSLTLFSRKGGMKSSVKRVISTFIGRRKMLDRNVLLLHTLRNESYYYAARRALEIKTTKKKA